jgi:hypothetical protein
MINTTNLSAGPGEAQNKSWSGGSSSSDDP